MSLVTMNTFSQDLRYGLRMLLKNRGFIPGDGAHARAIGNRQSTIGM
jgi:hypothetical protein